MTMSKATKELVVVRCTKQQENEKSVNSFCIIMSLTAAAGGMAKLGNYATDDVNICAGAISVYVIELSCVDIKDTKDCKTKS
jgi:hypothetical protein